MKRLWANARCIIGVMGALGGVSCNTTPSFVCDTQAIQLQKTNVHESLYDSTAEYQVGLLFGTGNTAQTIPVVIDTGSSDLVVNGDSSICPSCTGVRFNATPPAKLVSSNNICLSYGSASGYAHTYSDMVGLSCGGEVSTEFAVMVSGPQSGCSSGGSQDSKVPNIFGLAGSQLSKVNPNGPTFLDTYITQNKFINQFTIMLCGSAGNSRFALGTPLSGVDISDMQYVNFVNQGFYWVNAKSIGVKGGKTLGSFSAPATSSAASSTGAPVIIDSGTTLTKVDPVIASAISQYLKQAAAEIPGADFPPEFWNGTDPSTFSIDIPNNVIARFPTLQITFWNSYNNKDVVMDVRPDSYLKNVGDGKRTLGIRASDPGDPGPIFGQSVLESWIAVFDREVGNLGLMSNATGCSTPITPSTPTPTPTPTPSPGPTPTPPVTPTGALIDCTTFISQSQANSSSSVAKAIKAKFATVAEATKFCMDTIGKTCQESNQANLVSGNTKALSVLCAVQYTPFLNALANGEGGGSTHLTTPKDVCENNIYEDKIYVNKSAFDAFDTGKLSQAKVVGYCINLVGNREKNCTQKDLNFYVISDDSQVSKTCAEAINTFITDVKGCVRDPDSSQPFNCSEIK